MTNVAAPLLAGFSITTTAAVAASSSSFRWPGAALLSLTLASILLVTSLQLGFHARQHLYSPADVAAWWSAEDLTEPGRADRLRREQHANYAQWQRSSAKARASYNAGIIVLALAVARSHWRRLIPPDQVQEALPWVAAAAAVTAALGELAWATAPKVRNWLRLRRLLRGESITG